MANYQIDSIINVEKDSFMGLDKTHFTTGGATVYMLHDPKNAPRAGDVIDGTIALDRRQNMKFTKTKSEQFQKPYPIPQVPAPTVPPAPVAIPLPVQLDPQVVDPAKVPTTDAPPTKRFQADPDKMAQDFKLDVAKNQSIMRQVALKAAVDLVIAGKVGDVVNAYVDHMQLLSEPDWKKFQAPMHDRFQDELPPVELYEPDIIPTDEQVMQSQEELGKAFDDALAKEK